MENRIGTTTSLAMAIPAARAGLKVQRSRTVERARSSSIGKPELRASDAAATRPSAVTRTRICTTPCCWARRASAGYAGCGFRRYPGFARSPATPPRPPVAPVPGAAGRPSPLSAFATLVRRVDGFGGVADLGLGAWAFLGAGAGFGMSGMGSTIASGGGGGAGSGSGGSSTGGSGVGSAGGGSVSGSGGNSSSASGSGSADVSGTGPAATSETSRLVSPLMTAKSAPCTTRSFRQKSNAACALAATQKARRYALPRRSGHVASRSRAPCGAGGLGKGWRVPAVTFSSSRLQPL